MNVNIAKEAASFPISIDRRKRYPAYHEATISLWLGREMKNWRITCLFYPKSNFFNLPVRCPRRKPYCLFDCHHLTVFQPIPKLNPERAVNPRADCRSSFVNRTRMPITIKLNTANCYGKNVLSFLKFRRRKIFHYIGIRIIQLQAVGIFIFLFGF